MEVYRRKWGNMQAVHCPNLQKNCVVLNYPRGRQGVVFLMDAEVVIVNEVLLSRLMKAFKIDL